MSESMNSLGLSKANAELFHKVQIVIGDMPENEVANDPERIYEACKLSNNFTDSELEILAKVYKKQPKITLLGMIKQIMDKIFKK